MSGLCCVLGIEGRIWVHATHDKQALYQLSQIFTYVMMCLKSLSRTFHCYRAISNVVGCVSAKTTDRSNFRRKCLLWLNALALFHHGRESMVKLVTGNRLLECLIF